MKANGASSLGWALLLLVVFSSSGCVYFRPDGKAPQGMASYWWDDLNGPDRGAPGDWQNYGD